jgi:mannosyl-oligosaccharide alpha-1,2-mannosidase
MTRVDPDANDHLPSKSIVLAVLGSLTLEFTRLTQITGNAKYYDAVQRVMNELEKWQDVTGLPGMWPAMVDASKINESIAVASPYVGARELYTLGALADSTYEYLPKVRSVACDIELRLTRQQFMILGGKSQSYKVMYEKFIEIAKKELFFRPMNVGDEDILIAGAVNRIAGEAPELTPELQHLSCFTGGMVAIAGKIFNRPDEVKIGAKLADGCVWAYKSTVSGIMPETFTAVPCKNKTSCPWDTQKWLEAVDPAADEAGLRYKVGYEKLVPGMTGIQDGRYLLRYGSSLVKLLAPTAHLLTICQTRSN